MHFQEFEDFYGDLHHSPVLIFTNFAKRWGTPNFIFVISNFPISKIQLPHLKFSSCHNCKISFPKVIISAYHIFKLPKLKHLENQKVGYAYFRNSQNFIFSDVKQYISRMFPLCFLYLLKRFCDTYGVRGSRFGHIFGVPKMFQKVLHSIRNH